MTWYSYIVIEIHEVGHYFDIGIINTSLPDDLLQYVSDAGREYEHGDTVLLELIEEILISFPAGRRYGMIVRSEDISFFPLDV